METQNLADCQGLRASGTAGVKHDHGSQVRPGRETQTGVSSIFNLESGFKMSL